MDTSDVIMYCNNNLEDEDAIRTTRVKFGEHCYGENDGNEDISCFYQKWVTVGTTICHHLFSEDIIDLLPDGEGDGEKEEEKEERKEEQEEEEKEKEKRRKKEEEGWPARNTTYKFNISHDDESFRRVLPFPLNYTDVYSVFGFVYQVQLLLEGKATPQDFTRFLMVHPTPINIIPEVIRPPHPKAPYGSNLEVGSIMPLPLTNIDFTLSVPSVSTPGRKIFQKLTKEQLRAEMVSQGLLDKDEAPIEFGDMEYRSEHSTLIVSYRVQEVMMSSPPTKHMLLQEVHIPSIFLYIPSISLYTLYSPSYTLSTVSFLYTIYILYTLYTLYSSLERFQHGYS